MKKKLIDGKEYGSKRVIRFVANIAAREYYKVKCLGCNSELTMERRAIEKGLKCRHCHAKATRPTSQIPMWRKDS